MNAKTKPIGEFVELSSYDKHYAELLALQSEFEARQASTRKLPACVARAYEQAIENQHRALSQLGSRRAESR